MKKVWAAAAVIGCWTALAGELDLSKIEIVRARKENPQQKVAADDLAKHLKMICGSTEEKGGFRFVFARPQGEPPPAPSTAHAKRVGNAVWFWGDDKGKTRRPCYGSAFGVYRFLERALGVRWVKPGDDGICWRDGVKPTLDEAWRWDWSYPNETALMRGIDKDWGRRLCYFEKRPFPYKHAFCDWQKRYLKDHPDYFGLSPYGTRGLPDKLANRVKLCLSNPKVIDQILANWMEAGTNAYINVCPNDGTPGYCFCANCRAYDADLPGENFFVHKTDRYLAFWNRLAARAVAIRPDVTLDTYIYSYYRFPPRREKIAYPDNMLFGYVPSSPDDFSGNLKAWRAVGMKRFFLRPNFLCYGDKIPRSDERFLYDTYHEIRAAGGIGFDYDGRYQPILGLEYYLVLRQVAFPELSFEAICDEYYSQFGALAPVAKAYFERVRARCDRVKESRRRAMAKANVLDDSELKGFMIGSHTEADLVEDAALLNKADPSSLSAPEHRRWDAFVAQVEGYVPAFRAARQASVCKRPPDPAGWRSSFDWPSLDGWEKRTNFAEITAKTSSFDRYSVRCKTTPKQGFGIWRRNIPVTPGATYDLSFDVKQDDGVAPSGIRVACSKSDGKGLLTLVKKLVARTGDYWQTGTCSFTVPTDVTNVTFYFVTGAGGEGRSVWLDYVQLNRRP